MKSSPGKRRVEEGSREILGLLRVTKAPLRSVDTNLRANCVVVFYFSFSSAAGCIIE